MGVDPTAAFYKPSQSVTSGLYCSHLCLPKNTAPRPGREPVRARRPAVGAGVGTMCSRVQAGRVQVRLFVPRDNPLR